MEQYVEYPKNKKPCVAIVWGLLFLVILFIICLLSFNLINDKYERQRNFNRYMKMHDWRYDNRYFGQTNENFDNQIIDSVNNDDIEYISMYDNEEMEEEEGRGHKQEQEQEQYNDEIEKIQLMQQMQLVYQPDQTDDYMLPSGLKGCPYSM